MNPLIEFELRHTTPHKYGTPVQTRIGQKAATHVSSAAIQNFTCSILYGFARRLVATDAGM